MYTAKASILCTTLKSILFPRTVKNYLVTVGDLCVVRALIERINWLYWVFLPSRRLEKVYTVVAVASCIVWVFFAILLTLYNTSAVTRHCMYSNCYFVILSATFNASIMLN